MSGKSFKSDEVDVVFQNGGGFKFSFAFEFSFEFLPGLPDAYSSCNYKSIRESNYYFAEASGDAVATSVWVQPRVLK